LAQYRALRNIACQLWPDASVTSTVALSAARIRRRSPGPPNVVFDDGGLTLTHAPQVINGFSDVMVEVFGEKSGRGARSAVGMNSLPDGSAVEIEAIFQIKT
jgi:hypothetical protein